MSTATRPISSLLKEQQLELPLAAAATAAEVEEEEEEEDSNDLSTNTVRQLPSSPKQQTTHRETHSTLTERGERGGGEIIKKARGYPTNVWRIDPCRPRA